jgi:hypothetical protein
MSQTARQGLIVSNGPDLTKSKPLPIFLCHWSLTFGRGNG